MQHEIEPEPELAFGRFLKFWRGLHRLSQEALADKLQSSPRHISRMENGSSRPSETMVLDICNVLSLGIRDSNHLLISAGFAAAEQHVDFHSPDMKWLRKSMAMTLKALDPYPTVLLDSSANILMVNRGWVGVFRNSLDQGALENVTNHYDFLFNQEGAGSLVSNREDTLSVILMSLKQRALFSNDQNDQNLQSRLESHPSVPEDWQQRAAKLEPMASFRVQMSINGSLNRFFSVITTVGALGPTAYASEPKLSIHTLYPEDDNLDLNPFIDASLSHPLLIY
ncbi:MAG: transcriptional regulator with XRE-family HTH domain [Oceanicoccus sp.]|jgi:transcriptional regulator with XRE-family HTH domain